MRSLSCPAWTAFSLGCRFSAPGRGRPASVSPARQRRPPHACRRRSVAQRRPTPGQWWGRGRHRPPNHSKASAPIAGDRLTGVDRRQLVPALRHARLHRETADAAFLPPPAPPSTRGRRCAPAATDCTPPPHAHAATGCHKTPPRRVDAAPPIAAPVGQSNGGRATRGAPTAGPPPPGPPPAPPRPPGGGSLPAPSQGSGHNSPPPPDPRSRGVVEVGPRTGSGSTDTRVALCTARAGVPRPPHPRDRPP